jgi:hypothetical protein
VILKVLEINYYCYEKNISKMFDSSVTYYIY